MSSEEQINVGTLRSIALDARKSNTTKKSEDFLRATEEAFKYLTKTNTEDGNIIEDIKEAASNGQFRKALLRWGPEIESQVYFGADEDGKNGYHIGQLINPRFNSNIEYKDLLIGRLRAYFNENLSADGETDEERRRNQIRVYWERRVNNPREQAIFVDWGRFRTDRNRPVDGRTQRPSPRRVVPAQRFNTRGGRAGPHRYGFRLRPAGASH